MNTLFDQYSESLVVLEDERTFVFEMVGAVSSGLISGARSTIRIITDGGQATIELVVFQRPRFALPSYRKVFLKSCE